MREMRRMKAGKGEMREREGRWKGKDSEGIKMEIIHRRKERRRDGEKTEEEKKEGGGTDIQRLKLEKKRKEIKIKM